MVQEERLQRIGEMVKQNKYFSINDICAIFNISKATARRDLKTLEERNVLEITRGGAKDTATGTTHEPTYMTKKNINHEEKVRIASKACSLLKPGDAIFIDSGTTTLELANMLETVKGITVATNDVLIGCKLGDCDGCDVTIIGGSIRKNYFITVGYLAQFALEHINADKAFLGVDAIDINKGCMCANMEEVIIKKLIIKAAKERIVLCDHSKFESVAFMNLCSFNEIDMIITGKELNKQIYSQYIDAGINIILA